MALAALLAAALVPAGAGANAGGGHPGGRDRVVHGRLRQHCRERLPRKRDPANPLDLPVAPGPSPLAGANFFIPGPARGAAAGAIAQLVGLRPKRMSVSESWTQFAARLQRGRLAAKLAANPKLAHEVAELSKIASQPQAQRLSIYSEGGGPGAIFAQAEKIFCTNMRADPHSIPIFTTDFLHLALRGCSTTAEIRRYMPVFRRRVDEVAEATDRRPAVFLVELDAIGSSRCMARIGSLHEWELALRYEINKLGSLPHTVVYLEAGYSDGNPVGYTARALNAVGIGRIRGFFTNDTHNNWTINEVRWATAIARRTHGAHFIVNTSNNGRGPKVNKNRVKNGNEDLCNPPGRGLGPMDTTQTGFPHADAFLWTHPPGNSSGCGGPPAGVFWPAYAVGLAERANQQLGPGYPSRPY